MPTVDDGNGVEPGRITATGLGRRFELRSSGPLSLKETILRRSLPPKRVLWALREVDLDVPPGEALGVIGQNGSGKSTLLRVLARIIPPSDGSLEIGGATGSLLELGAGFHPEFTGVENVYLNAAIHGLPREYVDEHLEEMIAFAELEDFADTPVKTYSSGMFLRLGFSVAVHINPDVLLVDEVIAVGDEAFQQRCHGKIAEFKRAGGTLVFISHDPGAIEAICDRAILLDAGRKVADGTPYEVLRAYHRRLSKSGPAPSGPSRPRKRRAVCRIVEVRAVDADGVVRDRLLEAEPVYFEVRLYSERGVRGAQVSVGLREVGGRLVGAQRATGVDLRRRCVEPVRLHLPTLPLRDGRFVVEVNVLTADGASELASDNQALEFSVFAQDANAAGSLRLGGIWELPAPSPEPVAESAES